MAVLQIPSVTLVVIDSTMLRKTGRNREGDVVLIGSSAIKRDDCKLR